MPRDSNGHTTTKKKGRNNSRPLVLEAKVGAFSEQQLGHIGQIGGVNVMMTPTALGDEDFWLFRVKLSRRQAIVGFPKFGTIGIGFAKEEDWNTNFPFSVPAAETYDHIKRNKGDAKIRKARVIAAIEMVREAAAKLKASAARVPNCVVCGASFQKPETHSIRNGDTCAPCARAAQAAAEGLTRHG